MIEKNIKLLKVFQVNNYEYNNYLVYFMENNELNSYELYLQNKFYGTLMFLYGVCKDDILLEDFMNNYNLDEYIQEYQKEYEDNVIE